jgi:tRNA(Ile)-lysidine synthetase-like protein
VTADSLNNAIRAVPAGAWGVGVSGGADSVALLALLHKRSDLHLHAIHLDHETREGQSSIDAQFVAELCANWGIPCTLKRRSALEDGASAWPTNRSARFRALRLALFRTCCASAHLQGVILAHHADDQAETIIQRLLRGSGSAGLTGMRPVARQDRLTILRPLLPIRAQDLRAFLHSIGQTWREDSSNASPAYQRNRVRAALRAHPRLTDCALELGQGMDHLVAWAREAAPALQETFLANDLARLPDVLALESARTWLIARGAPHDDLSQPVLHRLIEMARDAATPPRRHFPGKLLVFRRAGGMAVAPPD